MESVVFQVSAKTARLIGRENISDVDGAVIELIKNGYDADAECVFVKFIMPFEEIPPIITLSEAERFFKSHEDILEKYYSIKNGEYILKADNEEIDELSLYIRSLCSIIILDNGTGMTRDILKTSWMNIGTDDKEKNIYSVKKKRIKTGAKGIGRFALDKLSLKTIVYTKSIDDNTYKWELDWCQFDQAALLNQVQANLNGVDADFIDIISNYVGEDINSLESYNWSSGTMIILNPIREFWSERLYRKVNNNLSNINPLGSVDKFDVIVSNPFKKHYNACPTKESIERSNYDYMIEASFDGDNSVHIVLDRNEIDISDIKVEKRYSDSDIEQYDIGEFWQRDAFKKKNYTRNDFDGKIGFDYLLEEIVPVNEQDDMGIFRTVGPFSLLFYYLKNDKSSLEIIKKFQVRKRKKLLGVFSGVKLYRDNFKVKPYGDAGAFYDWLNLGERVQNSPAAASHPTGKWRVSPNQIIGSVSISRLNNPLLQDNANREGMSLNIQYDSFVKMVGLIISKFEFDRQYVLREYAAWKGEKERTHRAKAQEIYEQYKNELTVKKQTIDKKKERKHYTAEELKDAIITLGNEKEKHLSTEQLMMVLSASGVLAQTFSHEITRMETEFGSRGQQLRASIDMLLNHQPYEGDEDFNPYLQIKELDETDLLLSEWVELIMDSISKDKFALNEVNICEAIQRIVGLWAPLLERKYISIKMEVDGDIDLKIQVVELHLLINNFILNSAYYLEDASGQRKITIKLYIDGSKIICDMKNNGPVLDAKYAQFPDETLEAGETSKKGGTGLGLWIAREAILRSDGELHVIPIEDGYLLRATWPI